MPKYKVDHHLLVKLTSGRIVLVLLAIVPETFRAFTSFLK
jgi:hypothetical protein